jgi:hypothetical protein
MTMYDKTNDHNIKKKTWLVVLLLWGVMMINQSLIAQDYVVDGNSVYIDDVNAYIRATPHTLFSSGYIMFNVTSKVFTGDVDVVFGFDTDYTKPKSIELYKPTTTSTELSYTCAGYFNYTLTPKRFWCYDGNNTLLFTHEFDRGDLALKTAYWNETTMTLWKDYSHTFSSINYNHGGMNKWWYARNVPIESGNPYTFRVYIDVNFLKSRSGKYWFAIKPSSETIQQAIVNNHFYALDPWWNVSFTKKRLISNLPVVNITFFNITYDSDMKTDFSDLRFADSTDSVKLDYWIENFTTSSIALVRVESNLNTSIYMYYNNTGASSESNHDNIYPNSNYIFYGFDEYRSSSVVYDYQGIDMTKTNAAIDGATFTTFGKHFSSFSFDGDNDLLNTGSDVVGVGADSFCAWLYLDTFGEGGYGRVIDNGKTLLYVNDANDCVSYCVRSAFCDNSIKSTDNSIKAGRWIHTCVTRDAAGVTNFYINGTLSGVADQNAGSPEAGGTLMIGDRSDHIRAYDGYMDDVLFYSKQLTAAEVWTIYNTQATNYTLSGEITPNIKPNITLNTPLHDAVVSSPVTFNCSVEDDTAIQTVSLYVNDVLKDTMTDGSHTYFEYNGSIALAAGFYNWTCLAYDTQGEFTDGVAARDFIVTSSPTTNATTTSVQSCRYKKFGYYNPRLPWIRQEGCI